MVGENLRYYSFPIALLQGVMSRNQPIEDSIQNITKYVLYYHASHLPQTDEGHNSMETQLKATAKFYNMKIGSVSAVQEGGKYLCEKYDGTPICSVNKDIIWNLNNNNKTHIEIAAFCGFCAIRSIIGKKEYAKTNKKLVLARMFGYSTVVEFETNTPNVTAKSVRKDIMDGRMAEFSAREKYSKRYQMDEVLNTLELSWGLKRYADHIRGMYVSFTKSLNELAILNELSKRKVKLEGLKLAKAQAKEKAQLQQHINSTSTAP